jgi:two-component system phosphate regulon sensor histidine kinase PhoR
MDIAWLLVAVLLIACIFLLLRIRSKNLELASLHSATRQARERMAQLTAQVTSEQQMRLALIDTLIDPVLYVDADRTITLSNMAAQQLTRGEARPGRSLMEALRSYELDNIVAETLNSRNDLPREITIGERLYRVSTAVLAHEVTEKAAVVILRDVSELQRLGRARRDFVANISHELRTPLTAIRLLTDTLRIDGALDTEERARHLDQISAQVDALTQLAQEMYDLSQIESGQVPMRMVRTPLHDLVDQVIVRLTPQATRAETTLTNDIGDDVYALVDPAQISRVLINLLHNAIKFTSKGSISVYMADNTTPQYAGPDSTRAGDDYVTVAVRDTGAGIAKADLTRIFERFYKANRARGQGGTGLGLAIAKHIVEAHGGHIRVESVEGKGATFYFTVPKEDIP